MGWLALALGLLVLVGIGYAIRSLAAIVRSAEDR